jgi:hypothetical protein
MNSETKRDLSISMLRANVTAVLIMIPAAILQFSIFQVLHGGEKMEFTIRLLDVIVFLALLIASIVVHEFIHGLTWVVFGKKNFSAVKFDMHWKTLTPYAHFKEPIEVNLYRLGGFMPGFILGILFFIASLILGNSYLLWFSMIQTAAASGDWLILWILRTVKRGTLVEDHPSRVGCYVYET